MPYLRAILVFGFKYQELDDIKTKSLILIRIKSGQMIEHIDLIQNRILFPASF